MKRPAKRPASSDAEGTPAAKRLASSDSEAVPAAKRPVGDLLLPFPGTEVKREPQLYKKSVIYTALAGNGG